MKKILLLGSLLVLSANAFSSTIANAGAAGEVALVVKVEGTVIAAIEQSIEIKAMGTSADPADTSAMKVNFGEISQGDMVGKSVVGSYEVNYKGTTGFAARELTATLSGTGVGTATSTASAIVRTGLTIDYTASTPIAATAMKATGNVTAVAKAAVTAVVGPFNHEAVSLIFKIGAPA